MLTSVNDIKLLRWLDKYIDAKDGYGFAKLFTSDGYLIDRNNAPVQGPDAIGPYMHALFNLPTYLTRETELIGFEHSSWEGTKERVVVELRVNYTRASRTVSGATNASPIVVSTYPQQHGLMTGDSVTISGVGGNTAANGTHTITEDPGHNPFQFILNGTTGNGTYTSGGTFARQDKVVPECWKVDFEGNQIKRFQIFTDLAIVL